MLEKWLRDRAESILEELDIPISDAIELFYKKSLNIVVFPCKKFSFPILNLTFKKIRFRQLCQSIILK